jgi:hypothetical protein
MDSIMVSLLVAMYTGNGDWMQGVYVKDLNKNIWKHISWDFDVAFVPSFHNRKGHIDHSYEIRSLYLGLDHKKAKRPWYRKIRYLVFSKLIHKDQKFRKYFSNLVDRLYLDVISSNGMKNKFELYNKLARDSKDSKMQSRLRDLELFFKKRHEVFCSRLLDRLNLKPKSCEIK